MDTSKWYNILRVKSIRNVYSILETFHNKIFICSDDYLKFLSYLRLISRRLIVKVNQNFILKTHYENQLICDIIWKNNLNINSKHLLNRIIPVSNSIKHFNRLNLFVTHTFDHRGLNLNANRSLVPLKVVPPLYGAA